MTLIQRALDSSVWFFNTVYLRDSALQFCCFQ